METFDNPTAAEVNAAIEECVRLAVKKVFGDSVTVTKVTNVPARLADETPYVLYTLSWKLTTELRWELTAAIESEFGGAFNGADVRVRNLARVSEVVIYSNL